MHPLYSHLLLRYPKSIRILTILPGEDDIESTIEVVSLDQRLDPDALSYVWNPENADGKPQFQIQCNGLPIDVGSNLAAALRRLRPPKIADKSDPKPPRRIWIDALCINQEDTAERAKQVAVMLDIYELAANVIVWLGVDTGFASDAISLIQRIARVAEEEGGDTSYDRHAVQSHRDDLPAPGDASWDLINLFYSNPWFRRVWCTQEAAKGSALPNLGQHEISLSDVDICVAWMNPKRYSLSLKTILALVPSEASQSLRKGGPFGMRLSMASSFEAKDPRDKIYALLGLFSKYRNSIPDAPAPFQISYTRTTMEVYGDFVRYFISLPRTNIKYGEGSLKIMLQNQSMIEKDNRALEPTAPKDKVYFPSWIPRWDRCRPIWKGLGSIYQTGWQPSADMTPVIGERKSSTVLTLRRLKVCRIGFMERKFELPSPKLTDYNTLVKETLRTLISQKAWKYEGQESLKRAFAHTLTAGEWKDKNNQELYGETDLEAYCAGDRPSRFADVILNQHTFFTTPDGYMGIGSRTMQVGDDVCLFFGGEVLFLLRPVGEVYLLIGECYVHGLMHGEAVEMLKSGALKEQWFDLQ